MIMVCHRVEVHRGTEVLSPACREDRLSGSDWTTDLFNRISLGGCVLRDRVLRGFSGV